jgi:hypothetical protein
VAAANPGIEIRIRLARGEREATVSTAAFGGARPASGGAARAAARRLRQGIDEGIAALGMRG